MDDLSRKIARMFCVGFEGQTPTAELREMLDRGVQHVILFARNIKDGQQVFDLTAEMKNHTPQPIMICIDQEGGRVRRLREGFTPIPAMRALGQIGDEKLARRVGEVLGRELRSVNIDVDFAPCMDVDTNPANPVIAARSFGADPALVARLGCALLTGMQQQTVAACVKHFPGHGDTRIDSHLDLPRVNHSMDRLNTVELPPFQAAIDVGVASIMSAHVIVETLDPEYPATLSALALEKIVRGRMKFDGVIFTDDFEMKAIADHYGFDEAIVRGVLAGCDVILICHSAELQRRGIETLIKAVENGQVSRDRIDASNQRIDRMIAKYFRPASEKYTAIQPDEKLVDEIERKSTSAAAEGRDPTEYIPRQI